MLRHEVLWLLRRRLRFFYHNWKLCPTKFKRPTRNISISEESVRKRDAFLKRATHRTRNPNKIALQAIRPSAPPPTAIQAIPRIQIWAVLTAPGLSSMPDQ